MRKLVQGLIYKNTGNQAACELLVSCGRADIDKQDQSSGWTALMQSIYYGHSSVTRYLLQEGANVLLAANNGCTAFQMASLIGSVFMSFMTFSS